MNPQAAFAGRPWKPAFGRVSRLRSHHLIGAGLAVLAALHQMVISSAPTNDDFVHVVLARQIMAGDLPVQDFFDLGVWLTYGLSIAGQVVFGHRLLAEGAIVAVMLTVSTYLVFRLVRELTDSTIAAALSAVLLAFASVRGYSYPKLIVYAGAATLWWWYVRDPAARKILAFGVWVAAAFYWRGDHGVYVAGMLVLAVLAAHGISRASVARVCQAGSVAFILVTPVLATVLATVGLASVLRSVSAVLNAQHTSAHSWPKWPLVRVDDFLRLDPAEEFAPIVSLRWTVDSTSEARVALLARHRMVPVATEGSRVQVARLLDSSSPAIRALINEPIIEDTSGIDRGQSVLSPDTWPTWQRQRFSHWWLRVRVLPGVDEQSRASQAVAALFYALPLLVLGTAPALGRYLPGTVTARRLAWFASAGLLTAFGLMRTPYEVRAVDDVVVPAILFGCCVAALWRMVASSRSPRRWLARGAAVVLALFVMKSVAVAGQFGERLTWLAGDWRSVERMRGHWQDVWVRLAAQPPLKSVDDRTASVPLRLAQYASECLPQSKRLLVLWAAPEIYYYADRLMAARHFFFVPEYESLPLEERLSVEKIRRYEPPLAFATSDLDTFTRETHPDIVEYVRNAYEPVDSIEEEGVRYIILLKRNEPVLRPYGEHDWPCFS